VTKAFTNANDGLYQGTASAVLNATLYSFVIPTEPLSAASGGTCCLPEASMRASEQQVPRLRESVRCANGLTPLGMTKIEEGRHRHG